MRRGSPGLPPTQGQAEAGPLMGRAPDTPYARCANMARLLSDRAAPGKSRAAEVGLAPTRFTSIRGAQAFFPEML